MPKNKHQWLLTIHLECGTKLLAKVANNKGPEMAFVAAYQRWENAVNRSSEWKKQGKEECRCNKNGTISANCWTCKGTGMKDRYVEVPVDPRPMPNKGNGVSGFAIEDGEYPSREEFSKQKLITFEPI